MEKEIKITEASVIDKIFVIRDQKVLLDKDLAKLYGVTTGNLNKAVGRNINRFPDDFMFELTKEEFHNLRSQFAASSWGGTRKMPKAFTEQGVAMLSGVLQSERAIMVNIQIMRAYSKLRTMLSDNISLRLEIEEIKKKLTNYGKNIELVFHYLDELVDRRIHEKPRTKIGYKKGKE